MRDNLPPPTMKEIEDELLPVLEWYRRKQLAALKLLYRVCGCRIDDIPREMSKELVKEIEAKKRRGT
jgi:hypothetical protein